MGHFLCSINRKTEYKNKKYSVKAKTNTSLQGATIIFTILYFGLSGYYMGCGCKCFWLGGCAGVPLDSLGGGGLEGVHSATLWRIYLGPKGKISAEKLVLSGKVELMP